MGDYLARVYIYIINLRGRRTKISFQILDKSGRKISSRKYLKENVLFFSFSSFRNTFRKAHFCRKRKEEREIRVKLFSKIKW